MRILNLLLATLLLNGLHPGLAAAQTTNTSDQTSVSVRLPSKSRLSTHHRP